MNQQLGSHLMLSGLKCCWLGLLLSLAVTPVALAGYEPKDLEPPQTSTDHPGRGDREITGGIPLILLAPQTHVGKTTSTHPTFAWFFSETQIFDVEFRLFECDEIECDENSQFQPWGEPIEKTGSSGMMSVSLPREQPGLTLGKRYLWQVTIIGDPNAPGEDLEARAEIEVSRNLEGYQKENFWYDLLAEALNKSSDPAKLGAEGAALIKDLVEVEESALGEGIAENWQSWLENLRQIADREH